MVKPVVIAIIAIVSVIVIVVGVFAAVNAAINNQPAMREANRLAELREHQQQEIQWYLDQGCEQRLPREGGGLKCPPGVGSYSERDR